jgi:hypothetical protein
VQAIFSPEFSRPLMVDLAKPRMTFSVGGQGGADLGCSLCIARLYATIVDYTLAI